jgi:hypothetical protein
METETNTKPVGKNFNKTAYIVFVIAGIYFLVMKDFSQAAVFWGISLMFDPFNTAIPFPKRPLYQRAWLYIHVSTSLAMFVLVLMGK